MQGEQGAGDGDAVLARLDFLGNLYVEDCTLFKEGPVPVSANKARRVVLHHSAHYPQQPVEPCAGRHCPYAMNLQSNLCEC